jgi:GntR family transcriptional regulator, transcriptional repressor for pyruvate dehydrogenase complex
LTLVERTTGTQGSFAPVPITTASAAEQIAEQIRLGILRGQLRPGERLPSESELASEYSVSRGTIRETMKLLAAQQFVQATRGASGGTFVRVPEHGTAAASLGETIALWFNAGDTSLAEVNAAREWIERGCVQLAVVHHDDRDLEAIRMAVEAMEQDNLDMDDMLAIDIEFHEAVAAAAHNSVLELAMTAILLMRPFTNTMLVPHLGIEAVAGQHRAIYEAIGSGKERAAIKAFDAHMAYLHEVREQALADRREEDVQIATLSSEAHPAFERIRARVLARTDPPNGEPSGPTRRS